MPDPSVSDEVGLEALLVYAHEHAPLMRVARSTHRRADAARAEAWPLLPDNPIVTAGAGPRFGSQGTGIDVEVSVQQQIWISGERDARMDAAERFAELVEAEVEQARWQVHSDVHAAFHRALVARERAAFSERVVSFQEAVLRTVTRQAAAGEIAPLTMRLAEAELAQARQQSIAAAQSYFAARIELGALAGWPVTRPPVPMGALDSPRDPPEAALLIRVARARLPEFRAREARVDEALARETAAHRAAWPRPSIGASYRHEGNTPTGTEDDIVLGTLTLPLPIFQTNQGEQVRARGDVEVAEAELEARTFQIAAEIARLRSEAYAAAQRVRSYGNEILPRFQENIDLLRRAYELGEIDLPALLVARERFLRIQSDALDAHLDYFIAIANLERLVGVDLWHDHHGEAER